MSNGTLTTPAPVQDPGLSSYEEAGTKRSLSSRLSVGHVLTALAGLLTFVFFLLILAERSTTEISVVVAQTTIEEGVPLTADLFDTVNVPDDSPLATGGVSELAELDGTTTAQRTIPEGSVLYESDFLEAAAITPGGGLRSISIPVKEETAVGGALRTSDLVDLIAADGGVVWIPVAGVEVLDTGSEGGSGLGAVGSDQSFITLAVTADQAVAIAQADSVADIYVVRSTGAKKLPVLPGGASPDEIGVSSPSQGFETQDLNDSLNDALGGVLDDLLEENDG
jgi:Flp pilus assembly protein CpaB